MPLSNPRKFPLILCSAICLVGCGGQRSTPVGEANPPALAAFVTPALTFPTQAPNPGGIGVERAFPGLRFFNPLLLTHSPDASDRIFVVEQRGDIRVFPNDDAAQSGDVKTFLDIRSKVTSGGEMGLLGLAFDPEFAQNGFFYVNYTTIGDVHTVVSRFSVDPNDPNRADPASEYELMRFQQPTNAHNGGMLAFGADWMLYISVGDGGGPQDVFAKAQDLTSIYGKILRIDPRQPSGGLPYTIPADNPLLGTPGAAGEIWAWGFRNPWRISFDRNTGELWGGDVGLSRREEIDYITKGGNYGWPVYEGNINRFNPGGLPPSLFEQPVVDYEHDLGGAAIGGYVYRGCCLPDLRGSYVYGDNASGRIWALVYKDGQLLSNEEIALVPKLTSFGEDEAGELYPVSHDGRIYRMVSLQPNGATFPNKLSETGLFTDMASMTPAPGVVPYEVNAPLWSDGADKKRWIAVPTANSIEFSPSGNWLFPKGTVLVKHFELPTLFDHEQGRLRLETRVLVYEELGWAGYTYKWQPGSQDAFLISDRVRETYGVSGHGRRSSLSPTDRDGLDPDMLQQTRSWTYPSRPDCLACHTESRGAVLGVRTLQLNGSKAGDQLSDWLSQDFFSTDIGASSQYPGMPNPLDHSADLEERARSYLDANCAQCHLPGGSTPVVMDLRYETPLAQTGTIDVTPQSATLGINNPAIIRSGDRHSSVLWKRLGTRGVHRMPPLGTERVDQAGLDMLGRWIDSLR